ncbi:YqaA family protein [Marinomonas ostreistagni]|uniref:YqaA family protein n=1 Tax=Marinomonas ostreistagni TaxID=359209 RepID=UPI00194F34F2|nr:YqaA family protein [Marinomonas ostreistagni]MBM6549632.1 DedA family protein [Marinomonas ostreistagni]
MLESLLTASLGWQWLGLFVVSFLAATLLPLGSEVVLLAVVTQHPEAALGSWWWATLGNTLGGLTNWLLGRYFLAYKDRRWFPLSSTQLERVHVLFTRYGQPILLLSWLPAIGDGLCLAAGVARLKLMNCAVWVMIGKGLRYAVVIWGTNAVWLS